SRRPGAWQGCAPGTRRDRGGRGRRARRRRGRSGSVSIEVANESGAVDIDEERLSRLARYVLDAMRVHPLAELSLVLVDKEPMTDLNMRWMGAAGRTDVLSVPLNELPPRGTG